MPEPLDRDRIAPPGGLWRVSVFRETGSTNDLARRAAEGGEPEGLVVFAESQTRGRGQFGRVWDSRPGVGLWFSVLLRPRWSGETLPLMTPLVAVALARALAQRAVPVRIKPPNDIYHDGRKLAGILSEARSGREPFVVVGIGINVNHARADFPLELQTSATSVAQALGCEAVEREPIAAAVLAELAGIYRADSPPGPDVLAEYAALSRSGDCGSVRP